MKLNCKMSSNFIFKKKVKIVKEVNGEKAAHSNL